MHNSRNTCLASRKKERKRRRRYGGGCLLGAELVKQLRMTDRTIKQMAQSTVKTEKGKEACSVTCRFKERQPKPKTRPLGTLMSMSMLMPTPSMRQGPRQVPDAGGLGDCMKLAPRCDFQGLPHTRAWWPPSGSEGRGIFLPSSLCSL